MEPQPHYTSNGNKEACDNAYQCGHAKSQNHAEPGGQQAQYDPRHSGEKSHQSPQQAYSHRKTDNTEDYDQRNNASGQWLLPGFS